VMLARSEESLATIAENISSDTTVKAIPTDLADPASIKKAFQAIRSELGPVDILVNHASSASWKGILETTPEEFESGWRVTVNGAFLCSQEVVGGMIEAGSGAILFTGATSSVRGRQGSVAFSSAKFGSRGLADALARELWPKGIHVAHVIIDGLIDTQVARERFQPADDEPMLLPDAMASSYWHLIEQDRSSWTFELDLRPHGEAFFE
jgi:NAD(P)-dependent dehydrogenase (short-subunit alcohol dehydrogenase family)